MLAFGRLVRFLIAIYALFGLWETTSTFANTPPIPLTQRQVVAVQLVYSHTNVPVTDPDKVDEFARAQHAQLLGAIGSLEGYYMLDMADMPSDTPEIHVRWSERQAQQLRPRGRPAQIVPRAPADLVAPPHPTKEQWHLHNTENAGNDLNVASVWNQSWTGAGVTVAVIDDGVDVEHPDLRENYCAACSYNFLRGVASPVPSGTESHGTRCAGIIAASAQGACGVGVAYRARLAAGLLIDGTTRESVTLDALEASALTRNLDKIDVYSNSWGPTDHGDALEGPGRLTQLALATGTQRGRGGRGAIYVFASGNGGEVADNCNMDGYANSIYTIAIGAIDRSNAQPPFAEICSAQLAVSYAGTLVPGSGLMTTENRATKSICTDAFAGTSSAAPGASGLIALALQARPDLGWRDVQHIVAISAEPFQVDDRRWQRNGVGRMFHPYYGFGRLDAARLVNAAVTHTLLPEPHVSVSKSQLVNVAFDTDADMTFYVSVTAADADALVSVEHAQLSVSTMGVARTALSINLTSPAGTDSILMTQRPKDAGRDLDGWVFDTVNAWGEVPTGNWRVRVRYSAANTQKDSQPATLSKFELRLHGSCNPATAHVVSDGRRICAAAYAQQVHATRLLWTGAAALALLIGAIAALVYLYIIRSRRNARFSPAGGSYSRVMDDELSRSSLSVAVGSVMSLFGAGAPPSAASIDPDTPASGSSSPRRSGWGLGSKIWNKSPARPQLRIQLNPISSSPRNSLVPDDQPSALEQGTPLMPLRPYSNMPASASPNKDVQSGLPTPQASPQRQSGHHGADPALLAPLATGSALPLKGRTAYALASPLTPGLSGPFAQSPLSRQPLKQPQRFMQNQARFASLASPTPAHPRLAPLQTDDGSDEALDAGASDSPSATSPSKTKAFDYRHRSASNGQSSSTVAAAAPGATLLRMASDALKRTLSSSSSSSLPAPTDES